jgi:hypothetical protein
LDRSGCGRSPESDVHHSFPVDFTTLDFFRIEGGVIAEQWESVGWVRTYQSFGLLSGDVNDE